VITFDDSIDRVGAPKRLWHPGPRGLLSIAFPTSSSSVFPCSFPSRHRKKRGVVKQVRAVRLETRSLLAKKRPLENPRGSYGPFIGVQYAPTCKTGKTMRQRPRGITGGRQSDGMSFLRWINEDGCLRHSRTNFLCLLGQRGDFHNSFKVFKDSFWFSRVVWESL